MKSEDLIASAKILLVDDDPSNLKLCETILRLEGYTHIKTTLDPRRVVALFVEYEPDILILDIMMPHLDGLQLLSLLRATVESSLFFPILLTTAYPTTDKRHKALVNGAADVIEKPFDVQEFVLRISNLLKMRFAVRDIELQNHLLFQELEQRTEALYTYQSQLKDAQLEVIARLARAGEKHDDNTGHHTQRVAVTSGLIAQGLGLKDDEVEIIRRAAPLHDVGKIGVPDSILLKPGQLTDKEYKAMQTHCRIGSDMLAGGNSEIVQMAEIIALTHHEKWNGRGYPYGLCGEEIPLAGRILAVADVFDALTHERPYKKAWPADQALQEIRRQSGLQFDPRVVEAFLQLPHHRII